MRVLIIDDEPHARDRLGTLLKGFDDVEVVGSVGNGEDGLAQAQRLQPDLIFLDIQMPGMNGLEVASHLVQAEGPRFIFTTAYDEHAIRAFDLAALDYLLKPFNRARLGVALGRARTELERGYGTSPPGWRDAFRQLARDIKRDTLGERRLLVKDGTAVRFIELSEIEFIEAEGDYISIHLAKSSILVRERLKNIEARLAGEGFVRIHRSVIVNMAFVREVCPHQHGDYEFHLRSGAHFFSSPAYRENIKRLLTGGHSGIVDI